MNYKLITLIVICLLFQNIVTATRLSKNHQKTLKIDNDQHDSATNFEGSSKMQFNKQNKMFIVQRENSQHLDNHDSFPPINDQDEKKQQEINDLEVSNTKNDNIIKKFSSNIDTSFVRPPQVQEPKENQQNKQETHKVDKSYIDEILDEFKDVLVSEEQPALKQDQEEQIQEQKFHALFQNSLTQEPVAAEPVVAEPVAAGTAADPTAPVAPVEPVVPILEKDDRESGEDGETDQDEKEIERNYFFIPRAYESFDDEDELPEIRIQAVTYNSALLDPHSLVTSLCGVDIAYQLNEENWVRVGLANYHRQEYTMLITQLQNMFQNATLFVAFANDGDVCVSSNDIPNPIDLDYVLVSLTALTVNEYMAQSKLLDLENSPVARYFQLRTTLTQNRKEKTFNSKIEKFELSIIGDYQANLIPGIDINVDQLVFIQDGVSLIYFGTLQVHNFQSRVHFAHDYLTRIDKQLSLYVDTSALGVTLERLINETQLMQNAREIINNLQISRGVSNVQGQRIQKLILSIDRGNEAYKIVASNQNFVDFALSTQLTLHQCSCTTILSALEGHGELESININCQIRQFPKLVYAHLLKTPTVEKLMIRLEDQEWTFESFITDIVLKLNGNRKLPYQDKLDVIFPPQYTFVHNVMVEVQFTPNLMYIVDGEIGVTQWEDRIGNFKMNLITVNGLIREFMQVKFGPVPLGNLFGSILNHAFPRSMQSKSTLLFFSPTVIDLTQFQQLISDDFGPFEREFWNKGLYIQHVFDIIQDCENGQMCEVIWDRGLPNTDLHVKLYIQNFVEDAVLYGEISNFTLADNIVFYNAYIALPLVLNQDPKFPAQNVAIDDFYFIGQYDVPVQDGQSITFKGKLFFNQWNEGVLQNTKVQGWKEPFGFPKIQFNELNATAYLQQENSYAVQQFQMTGLAIFGKECFTQGTFDDYSCFYGNIDAEIDLQDFSNSYYEGYFTNVNMLQILTLLQGYDHLFIEQKIHQAILNAKIIGGCSISFASKNIVQSDEQTILTPQGTTIHGSATVLGLAGSIVLNILDGKLLGIFHFSTISIASGNILIFEESLEHSNNILLKVYPEENDIKDDQVIFQVKANLFNEDREIYLFISETDGFVIQIDDFLFSSPNLLTVLLTAPYSKSLPDSIFTATCEFSEEHILQIERLLKIRISEWTQKVQNLLITLRDHVNNLEQILNNQRDKMCEGQACEFQVECSSLPERQCSQYRKKIVCEREDTFCVNMNDQCIQEKEICTDYHEVCIQYEGDICRNNEIQCRNNIVVCSEYKGVCTSERITTCANYITVDDPNQCQEYYFGCDTSYVPDSTCQQECDRRQNSYQYYSDQFENQWDSLYQFENRLIRYYAISNAVREDPDGFLTIIRAGFEKVLDDTLKSGDLDVNFQVICFSRGLLGELSDIETFNIPNYNFANHELVSKDLFQQIVAKWAQYYEFDSIIISHDPVDIIQSIFGESILNSTETVVPQNAGEIVEFENEVRENRDRVSEIAQDLSQSFQSDEVDQQVNQPSNLLQTSDPKIIEQARQYHNHEFLSLYRKPYKYDHGGKKMRIYL